MLSLIYPRYILYKVFILEAMEKENWTYFSYLLFILLMDSTQQTACLAKGCINLFTAEPFLVNLPEWCKVTHSQRLSARVSLNNKSLQFNLLFCTRVLPLAWISQEKNPEVVQQFFWQSVVIEAKRQLWLKAEGWPEKFCSRGTPYCRHALS